ncbi:hypothetical protein GCM10009117_13800 [Gangjinia marincola]|uniref:Heme A synthase n=1 Tax=Gangjinia marincola TaxID=578463 RepID=A0ABN1MGD7_9FLAO
MYRRLVKISLILVYLVIVAGALVRMTGSGMGCPDWPKCFGYYIPPTESSELMWQANKEIHQGQVIIVNESLQVAKSDFTSGETYQQSNWEPYTKHDYATFNVWHTWIEYLNRLVGALAGLAILFMAFVSIKLWKDDKAITLLSWFTVFLMGFQAWLGATVVYSVLVPAKITTHMLVALLIVALLVYLLEKVTPKMNNSQVPAKIKGFLVAALVLTIIQIIMGTQVRHYVDDQIDLLGYNAKDLWLNDPMFTFYAHRSFSIIVLLVNVYLLWQIRMKNYALKNYHWVLALIGIEILSGMAMYYVDFPVASQPLHLVIASLLFGMQFYVFLQARNVKKV